MIFALRLTTFNAVPFYTVIQMHLRQSIQPTGGSLESYLNTFVKIVVKQSKHFFHYHKSYHKEQSHNAYRIFTIEEDLYIDFIVMQQCTKSLASVSKRFFPTAPVSLKAKTLKHCFSRNNQSNLQNSHISQHTDHVDIG